MPTGSDLPTRSTDVLVIGAGPAGTAAATHLARRGRSVIVVDKAVFPRDKCCGDGLTTLALRELELLRFDPHVVPSWRTVDVACLRSPSGREVVLALPPDGMFAATTPRRELDAGLVELARTAGADVFEGNAFESIGRTAADGPVRVVIDGIGAIEAQHVVAADGMWSPVRRALGHSTDGYLGEWHAFRQYASGVTGPARDRLCVWFDADLLPGYAWSFPLPDGRVNIGFGVQRDGDRRTQDMKALWPEILGRPHVRAALGEHVTLEGRHLAWPIPAGIDRATLADGRVLFVGDAAMATDTMTGEGIGQALLTGRLAAEAIVGGGAAEAAQRYQRATRRHLVADHRMSVALSRVLRSRYGARGAVRLADTNEWTRRNFARWMFEDEPRAIALTPSRWHRRFLRRPGPYEDARLSPRR